MTFWLLVGALCALVIAVLLWPLLRRPADTAARGEYDLAVYRDQLAEVERDVARGVLSPDQADASRTEIERRILALAGQAGDEGHAGSLEVAPSRSPDRQSRLIAAGLAVVLPAAAFGLYLLLGAPGHPSAPFAERAPPESAPQDMLRLVDRLAKRLADAPDDLEGWVLLGRSYAGLGRHDEAVDALRQAVERGVEDPEIWAALGEALVAANGGRVVPGARKAIATALDGDPANPRARYYQALGLVQDGRLREALDRWVALAADAPPDASWRDVVRQQIAETAASLGLDPDDPALAALPLPPRAPRGPSRADVEAMAELSSDEQAAFIRSMVDGLAARLEEEPDDLEGWIRLARAYVVLGEDERAERAVERAAQLVADLPSNAPERAAVERARGALSTPR